MEKLKIGIIGFGRLGKNHFHALSESELWEVKYICDITDKRALEANAIAPQTIYTTCEDDIFQGPEIDAVSLCTLADARLGHIRKAVKYGKHILAEKPLSDTIKKEWEVVDLVERSSIICTVDFCQRYSWYADEIKRFIQSGEIGELAIVRVCHMTPGLAPGEGHESEGPSFHDCGIHYLDIARWYAQSEFKTGHAQAVRMWSYKEPWWLQCHGTFENGVVFDVTQGHIYGQLAKDLTHLSYTDIIGTKGIVRMSHDFKIAVLQKRGVTVTETLKRPYGDKNLEISCMKLAQSILKGERDDVMPTFRDAAIASEFAWRMLADAAKNDLPAIGNLDELDQILKRRATMTNGYGLIR